MFDVVSFWRSVVNQERTRLEDFFLPDAVIRWHNTNEQFSVGEFIRANCDYPGQWRGQVERVERTDGTIITVIRVFAADDSVSFHVVSFIRLLGERIAELDEYWSEDGEPPDWRKELRLGSLIRSLPSARSEKDAGRPSGGLAG